jgi:hypothetical protein
MTNTTAPAEVLHLRCELAKARAARDRLAAVVRSCLAADSLDQLAALAELEARRWTVRGEARTRDTFADPHPDDRAGTEAP